MILFALNLLAEVNPSGLSYIFISFLTTYASPLITEANKLAAAAYTELTEGNTCYGLSLPRSEAAANTSPFVFKLINND